MTQQPPPPPPISPEAVARLEAENAALSAQIANQALRAQAGGGPDGAVGGGPGRNVSVVRDQTGRVVVTGADGRTVIIDPKVGLDEDAVQEIVQTALEPPRIPLDPNRGPDAPRITAIVFLFLFLMTLVITIGRVLSKRATGQAVGPGVPADLAERLARIEQAVETVAIEVERISESERYSARLLTERLPERLPARPLGATGQAAPGQALAAPTLDATR
jgi:hypothetical protein